MPHSKLLSLANLLFSKPHLADQCQPTSEQGSSRYNKGKQSVCRQCFATCDNSASNGRFCLHHDEDDKSMEMETDNPITSLYLPKWDETDPGSLTYYNLEDSITGGNSLQFWTRDLMTESILNWMAQAGPFALLNTHMDDEYDDYGLQTGNQA